MTSAVYVFVVLAGTIVLFASDRLRLDLVALLSLLALTLGGSLSASEALAGFADPVTVMIAGLFVVGAGLFETGIADRLGDLLARFAGDRPTPLILALMTVTALLSAFLSSTGTVAVLLPVALVLARRAGLPPGTLLMPLAFSALLGGMLTLIGTPPNIVVAGQLRSAGLEPFGFFAFTPVGLVMLVLGMAYMATVGRRLLPRRGTVTGPRAPRLAELHERYGLAARLHRVEVPYGSPLVDRTLRESDVRRRWGITVLALASTTERGPRTRRAEPNSLIRANDGLYLDADPAQLERFLRDTGTRLDDDAGMAPPETLMLLEAIVPPRSPLVGLSLAETELRRRAGVTALALRRGDTIERGETARLRTGDTLLLAGGRNALQALFGSDLMVVVGAPEEWERYRRDASRAPFALAVLVGLLLVMGFGWLPNAVAVLLAAVAMVVTGCVAPDAAYRAINWESVVMIAAILPMATALETSGGLDLLVGGLVASLGELGPLLLMVGLFAITSGFSQVISNTATTVLLAPVAFQAAAALGVAPEPLLMTVAVAASTAFATPVASPVNALVLNPGGFRFGDFVRVGVPLQLLLLAATLLVVPRLFPF